MDRIETAHHEAGHAVVAYVLGLAVEGVSIVEDEASLGRCLSPLPGGFQPDEQGGGSSEILERHLAVCLAGAAAQELLAGDGEPVELTGNDLSGATTLVGCLGGGAEEMSAAAEQAGEKAEGILRRECAAVEAIAAKLMEHEELDGEEVARIIEREERG